MIDKREFSQALETEQLELSSNAFAANYLVANRENDESGLAQSTQLSESNISINRSSMGKLTSDLEELLDLRAGVYKFTLISELSR